jgi:hypothetical protein
MLTKEEKPYQYDETDDLLDNLESPEQLTEISDVELEDEIGAPKPLWLLNIEREEKKKRK